MPRTKSMFRQMAEGFQIDAYGMDLKTLFKELQKQIEEIEAAHSEEFAKGVESALVEHLENSLGDVFGLEQAFEAAHEEVAIREEEAMEEGDEDE